MSHRLFHPIAVILQGASMSFSKKTIGYLFQLGGIGAFAAGAVAGVRHVAIAAALFGGKKKGAQKLPERLNISCVEK
jgi:hypothetical protein